MKQIFIAVILSVLFFSCDKVENPYISNNTGGGDTTAKVRKALIEDFTGHKCPNCPSAAQTIETIKGIHGKKVVSIAIHSNFYATPGAIPFDYDFRTSYGNEYDVFFAVPAQPIGMINRRGWNASNPNHWLTHGKWSDSVNAVLASAPEAEISILNTYNVATRNLTTTVETKFLKSLDGTYKLIVLLLEDSIVKPQKDGTVNIMDYVHRHVLRDGISSTAWGDVLNTTSVSAGQVVSKTFQYTLPADFKGLPPNENQCYVVAYVYDAANHEVLQAEEKKMK